MQNIQIKYQKTDSSYEELFPVMLGIIPIGGIIMWSGAQDNIPQYWTLCNGRNGTPDLRNRFIVGAGGDYTIGDKGGEKDVALTIEQMPNHTHTLSLDKVKMSGPNDTLIIKGAIGNTSHNQGNFKYVASISDSNNRATSTTCYSGYEQHTHTLSGEGTIAPSGSSSAHENRPPYYALCFIMRIQ